MYCTTLSCCRTTVVYYIIFYDPTSPIETISIVDSIKNQTGATWCPVAKMVKYEQSAGLFSMPLAYARNKPLERPQKRKAKAADLSSTDHTLILKPSSSTRTCPASWFFPSKERLRPKTPKVLSYFFNQYRNNPDIYHQYDTVQYVVISYGNLFHENFILLW